MPVVSSAATIAIVIFLFVVVVVIVVAIIVVAVVVVAIVVVAIVVVVAIIVVAIVVGVIILVSSRLYLTAGGFEVAIPTIPFQRFSAADGRKETLVGLFCIKMKQLA